MSQYRKNGIFANRCNKVHASKVVIVVKLITQGLSLGNSECKKWTLPQATVCDDETSLKMGFKEKQLKFEKRDFEPSRKRNKKM